MLRKIFCTMLGFVMAVSMLQIPTFAEESKGYYWLEAEEASCSGEYQTIETDDASGGKLMGIYEINSGEYTVEFTFDNQKAGKYDIWFLSGAGSVRKLSKFKWSVNDSSLNAADTTDTQILYSEKMNKAVCDVQWNKITGDTTLQVGENKIKFVVDSKSMAQLASGERAYFNMIDAAVVVPSSWKWTPDGLNEPVEPEKIEADFAWIELENPDYPEELFTVKEDENASGGKVLRADRISPVGDEMSHTLSYSFEVDKNKSYDIWYLGFQSNVDHLCKISWGIDNPEADNTHGVSQGDEDPTCFEDNIAGTRFPLYWQKMDTQNISIGTHIFYIKFDTTAIHGQYLFSADCIMIVPSELGWNPNELNLKPSAAHGELVAKMFMNNHMDFFQNDFSNVTNDITLPDTKFVNQLDARIYYSADEYDGRKVISEDGTVERPYATAEGDAKINFYINAEYDEGNGNIKVGKIAIPMTVKKWNKYEVTKAVSLNKTKIVPGETVTAEAEVNIHVGGADSGKATILLVLYDAAGRMQKISMGEQSGYGTVRISAQMTMPENITGSKLRAYLINGLSNGNRLADTLTIGG